LFIGELYLTFLIRTNIDQWMLMYMMSFGVSYAFYDCGRFMIWPNEWKIKGYNETFAKMPHIIKPSKTRLIPNTWHLMLLILVPMNFVGVFVRIFR